MGSADQGEGAVCMECWFAVDAGLERKIRAGLGCEFVVLHGIGGEQR